MLVPTSASAIDVPNPLDLAPSINPADFVVDGFKSIIQYLLGDRLSELGKNIVNLLLAVPLITDHNLFPRLNDYRDYITGGSWGLLGLTFLVATMRYWLAGYSGSGAYEGVTGFIRSCLAISIMLGFSVAFDGISRAVNAFTVALVDNPIVGHSFAQALAVPVASGGLALLIGLAAVIVALILLLMKVIVVTLLAVLFVMSPLAIALWPIEEASWALRSIIQAMGALLVFPIIWAICFGVFAILPTDALFPGNQGDYINSILSPLISLAALIIMLKLPLKVLEMGMQAGVTPSLSRGLRTAQSARSLGSRGGGGATAASAPKQHYWQGTLWTRV